MICGYKPNAKLDDVVDWLELLSGSNGPMCWQVVGRWLRGAPTHGSTVYSKTHRRFMLEEEKLVGQGQPLLEKLMEACGGMHSTLQVGIESDKLVRAQKAALAGSAPDMMSSM